MYSSTNILGENEDTFSKASSKSSKLRAMETPTEDPPDGYLSTQGGGIFLKISLAVSANPFSKTISKPNGTLNPAFLKACLARILFIPKAEAITPEPV